MPRAVQRRFLSDLKRRFSTLKLLPNSRSLFEVPGTPFRIYVRYSSVHHRRTAFFGLREKDIRQLIGRPAVIAFLWPRQTEPLIIPFPAFEEVFGLAHRAGDDQYKVHVHLGAATQLYIARAGRYNVDGYFGWNESNALIEPNQRARAARLAHNQVQTLLGSIGSIKGNDVWLPPSDRAGVDKSIAAPFPIQGTLPTRFGPIEPVLSEIDVIWIQRGSSDLSFLFEIEHSTTIYSGLLRFNDVHLFEPNGKAKFFIVAEDDRRALYTRQIHRQTFERSGLTDRCEFMEYANVLAWHERVAGGVP